MSQYKYREKIIREAISEARRFIERAEVALDGMINTDYYHGGRENATMKRSSIDLSNMLAQLRKPL